MTTTKTTTKTKTKTTTSVEKLCASLEQLRKLRDIAENPASDEVGETAERLCSAYETACDNAITDSIVSALHFDADDSVSDAAVYALRERYVCEDFCWPSSDAAVAFAYAEAITLDVPLAICKCIADPCSFDDDYDQICRDYRLHVVDDGFSRTDEALVCQAVEDLRRLFREPGMELVDDTDEDYDELLRIGHLTVDDLLAGLPEGDGEVALASALITGGLVCDPNGRIYLEAFQPTEAVSNYPRHIADLLVDNRMSILSLAFDIIDLSADTRTVQLSRDVFATVLGFSEVPDEVWAPYVADWENDPHAAKWSRHEKRWQAVVGAYEELYDAYKAEQGSPSGDEDEDETERTVLGLDSYLVATGGWLKVEDEITGDQWLVNTLDVFGFDDARTLADAGDLWNSSHYRVRRHESAKSAA